jgi:hypothetical protein
MPSKSQQLVRAPACAHIPSLAMDASALDIVMPAMDRARPLPILRLAKAELEQIRAPANLSSIAARCVGVAARGRPCVC